MKADSSDKLLFVAGGPTGAGYIYNTSTGAPVSSYQFQTPPTATFINDAALSRGGAMLIVAHSGNGVLNLVDAATGASTTIADVSVPNVDGILIKGSRELFAVQNNDNLISV
jgi:hypothetical protein